MNTIMIIATLCALHTDNHYGEEHIQKLQEQCQKYYVVCTENNDLAKCIKDKK